MSSLQTHQKQHTVVKPYAPTVEKSSQICATKPGIWKFTREGKLYHWGLCGEGFSSRNHLKRHMKRHAGKTNVTSAIGLHKHELSPNPPKQHMPRLWKSFLKFVQPSHAYEDSLGRGSPIIVVYVERGSDPGTIWRDTWSNSHVSMLVC